MSLLNLKSSILTKTNKEAASNAVMNELKAKYSKNPNFPQTDEELKAMWGPDGEADKLLMPPELLTDSFGKQVFLWLGKLAYAGPRPLWQWEDAPRIKNDLKNFNDIRRANFLQGSDAVMDSYKTFEQLTDKVDEIHSKRNMKKDGPTGEIYTPEEKATISAGSTIIYDADGWKVFKVAKSSDPEAYDNVAWLLCHNGSHGSQPTGHEWGGRFGKGKFPVTWCVGWKKPSNLGRNYIPRGDFFVFQKNGISQYAISSTDSDMTLWNPADTPIYNSSRSSTGTNGNSVFKNIVAKAHEIGVSLSFKAASSVPDEIKGIFRELVSKNEPVFKKFVAPEDIAPPTEEDTKNMSKVILQMDPEGFIEDMNRASQASEYSTKVQGFLRLAMSKRANMNFDAVYDRMDSRTLEYFLAAWADTNHTKLAPALDEKLLALVEEWYKNDLTKFIQNETRGM